MASTSGLAAASACGRVSCLFCTGRGSGFTAAIFKVGSVPACSIQLKARRGQLFTKGFSPTFWASFYAGRAHFAHHLSFVVTRLALVIVNWHKLKTIINK